jgi:hypothetical protein
MSGFPVQIDDLARQPRRIESLVSPRGVWFKPQIGRYAEISAADDVVGSHIRRVHGASVGVKAKKCWISTDFSSASIGRSCPAPFSASHPSRNCV